MSTPTLQSVRPQDVEDWVYIVPETDEEPTVYETETTWSEPAVEHIDVLFKSEAPVEEPFPELSSDHQVYCDDDDDDIVADRVPPETAFELFLARNFPINDKSFARHDFSGSIYRSEQSRSSTQPDLPLKKGLPGAESREERLQRLISEVDGLSHDVGLDPSEDSSAEALAQVGHLRQQLNKINLHCSSSPSSLFFNIRSSAGLLSSNLKTNEKSNDQEMGNLCDGQASSSSIKVISPSLSTVYSLERRISALESSVNVHNLEHTFDGQSLTDLLTDVKTRLNLATDPELSSRLCEDAERIASILSKSDLSEALHLGSLLDKLYEWQPVIDELPIIIDRLTCVRHLHQEASLFVDSASKLSKLLDRLESRATENRSLLNTVRSNLQSNMQSVHQNIDSLLRKFDRSELLLSEPNTQSDKHGPQSPVHDGTDR